MVITAVVIGIVFIWLAVISAVLFKTRQHYLKLVSATKKEKLDDILDSILESDRMFAKEIDETKKALAKVVDEARFHYQKVRLVRFNPFEKRGREQSFVIALLDKDKNGILMNFMYAPDGLHVFTKLIKEGKGDEYDLSEEEKKAVNG